MVQLSENLQMAGNVASTPVTTAPKTTIGQTARLVLLRAMVEKRVIVGLSAAINILSKTPDDSLFCFLAQSHAGAAEDSAMHMSKTLLEAFCYENDIYIVKVDNADKLSRILGAKQTSCALIQKSWQTTSANQQQQQLNGELLLTPTESALIDHCEQYWDFPNQVMQLPV